MPLPPTRTVFSLAAIFLLIGVSAVLFGTIQLGLSQRPAEAIRVEEVVGIALAGGVLGAVVGGLVGSAEVRWYVAAPVGGTIGAITSAVAIFGLFARGAPTVIGIGSLMLVAGCVVVRAVSARSRSKELE